MDVKQIERLAVVVCLTWVRRGVLEVGELQKWTGAMRRLLSCVAQARGTRKKEQTTPGIRFSPTQLLIW
jgi:hypothetical protein